jgi:hypothetical protein
VCLHGEYVGELLEDLAQPELVAIEIEATRRSWWREP